MSPCASAAMPLPFPFGHLLCSPWSFHVKGESIDHASNFTNYHIMLGKHLCAQEVVPLSLDAEVAVLSCSRQRAAVNAPCFNKRIRKQSGSNERNVYKSIPCFEYIMSHLFWRAILRCGFEGRLFSPFRLSSCICGNGYG